MSKLNFRFNETSDTLTISKGQDFDSHDQFIFKIVSPSGDILHQNTGYPSDFSDPDVDTSTSLTINLDTDSSGKIVNGSYSIMGGWNDDEVVTEIDEIVNYCYQAITPEIEVTHDCYDSSITLTDNTDYTLTCAGTTITPSEKTRVLKLEYPDNIEGGSPADQTETVADTLVVTPIYTQNWEASLDVDLVYDIPVDLNVDDLLEVEVFIELYDHENHYVECDDCLCELYNCINQLFTQWMNSIGVNPATAKVYETQVLKLLSLYNLYYMAERCGETDKLSDLCTQIVALVNLTGCTCCDADDEPAYSTRVVPVGSASSTGSGSSIYEFSSDPSDSFGNDGDWGLMSSDGTTFSEGDWLNKVDGSWEFVLNSTGSTGADGSSSGVITTSGGASVANSSVGTITLQKLLNPFNGTNELTDTGDRFTHKFTINVDGDFSAGSSIGFAMPTSSNDFYIDVEDTNSADYNIECEITVRAMSDYDVTGTDVYITFEFFYNGSYIDAYSNAVAEDGITSADIIITSTIASGSSGSVTFDNYDVKFNKAI